MSNNQGKSIRWCTYLVGLLTICAATTALHAQPPERDFEASNSIVGTSNFLRYQQQLPAHPGHPPKKTSQPRKVAIQQAIALLDSQVPESGESIQHRPIIRATSFNESTESGPTSEISNSESRPTPPATRQQKKPESLIGFINQVLPSKNRSTPVTGQASKPHSATNQEYSPTKQATLFAMRPGAEHARSQPGNPQFGQPTSASQPVTGAGRIDLAAMLKRIGISTAIVLAGCVVFLLIAKKSGFGMGQNSSIGNMSNAGSRIAVIETKKLSSRCLLKLVEIDDSQFVVAEDNSGVKFVEPINKPFSASLDDLDAPAETKPSTGKDLTPAQTSQLASLISQL